MAKAAQPTEGRRANRRGAARLAAVQALYQMDLAATPLNEILARIREPLDRPRGRGRRISAGRGRLFRDVVRGVVDEQRRLDPMIDAALQKGWPLKRIETVLRAMLRAGAYELDRKPDVPARVVVSRICRRRAMPSSTATRPAWSMRCSTSSRGSCARASSTRLRGDAVAKRARPRVRTESGEDRLIARHFKPLARHPGALGLTDDAAVLTPPPGHELVAHGRRHRRRRAFLSRRSARGVARKALRVNLSDLAAKGAKPAGFLLTLALPKGFGDDWLKAFARGLGEDAKHYDCPLLGGDTVYTPGPVTISITAFGTLPEGTMVRRAGARAGDHVFVTGTIGDAALGLEAAQGARRRQALEARRGDAAPSRWRAISCREPRNALAEAVRLQRLRRDGRVRRACRRSRQAVPRLRRRRRDRGRARAAVRGRAGGARGRPRRSRPMLTGGDDFEIVATVPPAALDVVPAPPRARSACRSPTSAA